MVNKSDPISDKLERLSKAVDEMRVGELIQPTPLFTSIKINPTTGTGWYKMLDTIKTIPLKPLFDDEGEIKGFQKVDEEDLDLSDSLKKELKEIKKVVNEILKDVKK